MTLAGFLLLNHDHNVSQLPTCKCNVLMDIHGDNVSLKSLITKNRYFRRMALREKQFVSSCFSGEWRYWSVFVFIHLGISTLINVIVVALNLFYSFCSIWFLKAKCIALIWGDFMLSFGHEMSPHLLPINSVRLVSFKSCTTEFIINVCYIWYITNF